MDPLRYPDWESEEVSNQGIRRPCRVPHDVLDGLHVSGLVFPKVGWYRQRVGFLSTSGAEHPPGPSASPTVGGVQSLQTGVVVEA
jgi:hypothetical protein